jgi:hypothetical protein
MSARAVRRAGSTAARRDAPSARVAVKSRIRRSGARSKSSGAPFCATSVTSRGAPHAARRSPSPPPTIPSSADSVSSWRMSLPRLAPIARRSAISRRLPTPLARSRLTTLAHAMRRTKLTGPIKRSTGLENCRRKSDTPLRADSTTRRCERKSCRASASFIVEAWSSKNCAKTESRLILAVSTEVPGDSLPTMASQLTSGSSSQLSRRSRGSLARGMKKSAGRPTMRSSNVGGRTPTIVNGTESTTIRLPSTSTLPPNSRCQRP